ncbi:MAG: hypothetical protein LBG98_02870, partial [Puniceicoccales bacterium]|nr:hypothetical protein [Puniceicoccales bacterium]
MDDNSTNQTNKNDHPQKELLNLRQSLEKIHFGPDWTQQHYHRKTRPAERPVNGHRSSPPPRGGKWHTDRDNKKDKHFSPPKAKNPDSSFKNWQSFQPIVDVSFYPDDKAFDLLISSLRASCKTYELFQIARLILEKTERFVAVIRRQPEINGERKPLHLSLLDGIPFETEEETLNYILRHHLDEFFSIEEVNIEPPKGKFSCVH